MSDVPSLSPQLLNLVDYTERRLKTEIVLSRQADCPPCGVLVDQYTYKTNRDVIAYPSSLLGILKDCVIAPHVVRLLIRGAAHEAGRYQVLSYETKGAAAGIRQIYLDMLKDDQTRSLPLLQKRRLSFYIYRLFHDTLSEIPWWILAHSFVAVCMPALRNGQVYLLMREGLRDMHELVEVKRYIPRRYFIMHNGMFYARDMLLASLLSEYKLNPLINIPELQRFKNLDLKEMMTHRWSQSHWYQTKIVGDAMTSMLTRNLPASRPKDWQLSDAVRMYDRLHSVTDHFLNLMHLPGWYIWETPEHLASAEERYDETEKEVLSLVFGD
jgi:hypothetical protein